MAVTECYNCGNRDLKRVGNLLECPYCGSQYAIDDCIREEASEQGEKKIKSSHKESVNQKSETKTESNVEKLFKFSLKADMNSCKDSSKKIFSDMLGFCNNDTYFNDVSTFEKESVRVLSQMANKMGRLATRNVNTGLINIVCSKMSRELGSDERIIAYMDNGLISKGKDGVLITDKALHFIKGKKLLTIRIAEINRIVLKVNSNNIYFNDDMGPQYSEFYMCCYYDNGDTVACSILCTYIALRRREILNSESKIIFATI